MFCITKMILLYLRHVFRWMYTMTLADSPVPNLKFSIPKTEKDSSCANITIGTASIDSYERSRRFPQLVRSWNSQDEDSEYSSG